MALGTRSGVRLLIAAFVCASTCDAAESGHGHARHALPGHRNHKAAGVFLAVGSLGNGGSGLGLSDAVSQSASEGAQGAYAGDGQEETNVDMPEDTDNDDDTDAEAPAKPVKMFTVDQSKMPEVDPHPTITYDKVPGYDERAEHAHEALRSARDVSADALGAAHQKAADHAKVAHGAAVSAAVSTAEAADSAVTSASNSMAGAYSSASKKLAAGRDATRRTMASGYAAATKALGTHNAYEGDGAEEESDDDAEDDAEEARRMSRLTTRVVSNQRSTKDGGSSSKDADEDEDDDNDDDDDDDDDEPTPTGMAAPSMSNNARVVLLEQNLSKNREDQAENLALQREFGNETAFRDRLDDRVLLISNESQTPVLASFLGDMWGDMRKFAVPFFMDHLEKQMKELKEEEQKLMEELRRARGGAPMPKKTEPAKPVKAKFDKDDAPPVSTTMKCIIILLIQYFLTYTALAIAKTVCDLTDRRKGPASRIAKMLEAAATTASFAPMLAVLFLGTRMRAVYLTQGETEKYGLPQWWVQTAMKVCTWALLGQLIFVLCIAAMTQDPDLPVSNTGDVDIGRSKIKKGVPALIWNIIRYVLMLGLYGGFVVVCVGVVLMQGPKELWPGGHAPVEAAVHCTIVLIVTFFLVYLGVAIVHTLQTFPAMAEENKRAFMTKLDASFIVARFTVDLAPMLCVLFMGARIRALQIDAKGGSVQPWAQKTFFVISYAIVVQVIAGLFAPLIDKNCKVESGKSEGDLVFKFGHPAVNQVLAVIRYVCLACVYGGAIVIIASVFLIKSPHGPQYTPLISPAVQCTMFLVIQYVAVYTAVFICITLNSILQLRRPNHLERVIEVFGSAREAVMYAPMLSVLFLGARLRALQLLTTNDGQVPVSAGPPPFAQKAMFVCTWSVFLNIVLAAMATLVYSMKKMAGVSQSVAAKDSTLGKVLSILRYVALALMYGSACTIIYAVCTMTPEELPGYVKA